MRSVSNEFINLSKKIKTQDLKLTINDGELSVQEVHLMPVNIFNAISISRLKARKQVIAKELKYSFEGQLFKTIMQQIEITVKNASEIKGKNVNFQYGIQINNKFEYVDLGEYYIKDVEDDKNKEELVVTGYDKMLNFMKPFKQSDLQLTYPCTVGELVNRMGEVCGVELYSVDFFNSNLVVEEDFFTVQEATYRDVLEKIAQATLTTIFIKENKLFLCKLGENIQTLDTSFLSNLVIEEKFGPVNALVLGRGRVEDNIESVNQNSINTNGRCEIRFDENELVDKRREDVIDSMLQQIDGLEYFSIDASNLGLLWLEPCDVINVKDREDNSYKTIYLKTSVTINTGIKGEMQSEIPETTTTEYKVTSKEEKKTLKVERLAKKNEGLIQDIIEQNTETSNKLSQHEQSINGITDTVKSVETTLKTQTIQKVDVMYALSSSSTEAPTSGWQTTAPTWQNGKYMWQKTVTTYGDKTTKESDATCITGATGETGKNGKDGANGADGEKGETGIGVKSIEEQYYLSTSNTSQTDGSWKTTQDTWTSGKYIWTRNKITWTDNTATYTPAILATGLNNANSTANTAKTTADTTKNNLSNNYYTKTQTESQINQKADSITSSVSKEIAKSKEEAISDSNADTDEKLKEYTETEKLGTFIEQNYEYIKYAWNQISQYLKMEGLEGKASLNIYNENNNLLMNLNENGETFYNELGNELGSIGVIKTEDSDVLAFSMPVDWENVDTSRSMAWGVVDPNGKFLPIFYLAGYYGAENSEYGGELIVEGKLCVDEQIDVVKSGINFSGCILDGHNDQLSLINENTGDQILSISYNLLQLGAFLNGYINEAGGYTVKANGAFFAQDGYFDTLNYFENTVSWMSGIGGSNGYIAMHFKDNSNVYIYANSSDKKLKKNIEETKINALDIINKIRHVEFDWKDNDKHNDIGYIAQEMKEINENFVHYQKIDLKDGTQKENWQINTLSVLATATKAIQEQQKEIQNLQLKDKEKDELIQSLIKRIETLEEGVNK